MVYLSTLCFMYTMCMHREFWKCGVFLYIILLPMILLESARVGMIFRLYPASTSSSISVVLSRLVMSFITFVPAISRSRAHG